MAQHLTFGGSTIARTIACPGWVQESKNAPPQLESDAAAEGTLLHNCMEAYMMEDKHPDDMLGMTYKHMELTPDLLNDKLMPAVNTLEDLLKSYDIEEYICEPMVTLSDDVGGSIDFIGVSADRKAVLLVDYKFGYHQVHAVENKQLMFYALCASLDPATAEMFSEAETISMAIIQPTTEEGMAVYMVKPEVISGFEKTVASAIGEARKDNASIEPGEHCQFCPALPTCPVKTGQAMKAMMMSPDQMESMSEMLELAEQLKPWIKKVETVAHEQMELGAKVNGYKLVNKRASRVWNDTDAVTTMIRNARKIKLEEGFDMKLKSPAQMEKLCKNKKVDFKKYAEYISSVSSGTTLCREDDPRPAVTVNTNQLEELRKLT
jgi:hypothetical protein